MKWSAYLLHSTSGSTHTCRSSSLWTARDAYKQIRTLLGTDHHQRLVQRAWSAWLTRHCCHTKQPPRESWPARFGQKNPGCDTAYIDKGGKPDKNMAGIRKSTRLQIHMMKGSRKGARKAGLVQSSPEAVPGFAWPVQLLVFHTSLTSYHHPLWLHVAFGSCTCLQFSCFNSWIWTLKASFSCCTSCWKRKGVAYTYRYTLTTHTLLTTQGTSV